MNNTIQSGLEWFSVDPGRCMGLARWRGESLVSSGAFYLENYSKKLFGNSAHEDIIQTLGVFFNGLIDKYNPVLVVFEYPVLSWSDKKYKKGDAPFKQGEFIRRLKDVCIDRMVPWVEFNPVSIKRVFTGNGKAGKDQIRETVAERYGEVHRKNSNQADAVAIGYTYIIAAKNGGELPEAQKKKKKEKV